MGQKLPELSCIEKRDMLASDKVPQEKLVAYGDRYFERKILDDAAEFYKKAGHLEGLERVKRAAMGEGGTEILCRLAGYEEPEVSESDWRAAAEKARELGKYAYAEIALRRLGEDVEADKLREKVGLKPLGEGAKGT